MSKPARGTKRVCPSCGARFYDLGRSPITCPVCQAVYQISAPSSSRKADRAAPVPTPKPAPAEEKDAPVLAGAEVISLDEAAETEEAAVEDEEIVDLDDDDDEIPAGDDDDDTFLEEDEGGDEDVTGIVKGGKEEES